MNPEKRDALEVIHTLGVALQYQVYTAIYDFAIGRIGRSITMITVKAGLGETQAGVLEHMIERIENLDTACFEHLGAEVRTKRKIVNLMLPARPQGPLQVRQFTTEFP
jgi:hypothetical protein